MYRNKGKIFIKIKGEELKYIRDFEKYRELLKESLGLMDRESSKIEIQKY